MAAPCRIGTLLACDPLGPEGQPDAQPGRGNPGEPPPTSLGCPRHVEACDSGVGAACTPPPPPAPFPVKETRHPGPLVPCPWGSEHPEPLDAPGAVGRGPPANPPSLPVLMLGGTLLGQGTHPAPGTPPGWGGRAQPAPRPLGVSLAFPPPCTGQEARGAAGAGARLCLTPPFPSTMSPGGRDPSCGV